MPLQAIDSTQLETLLSQADTWRTKLLAVNNDRLIGLALVVVSRVMIPYWESCYAQDEKMQLVVAAMSEWAAGSTSAQHAVPLALTRVAYKSKGYLSPVDFVPPVYTHPGDFAGDAIVAAANAITEIGRPDFAECAGSCLSIAVEAISQAIGNRDPDDESTDYHRLAVERLRVAMLGQVQTLAST